MLCAFPHLYFGGHTHPTHNLCTAPPPGPTIQDPTLNLMLDRAFDEYRDSAPTGDDGSAVEQDSSRMIGIVSRLGGGKRALAVGLGSGGAAGEVFMYRSESRC